MYVTHQPDKHDEWVVRKTSWGKKKSISATYKSASTTSTSTQKLALSPDLKAAMIANFQCIHEEADKLWSNVVQNSALN